MSIYYLYAIVKDAVLSFLLMMMSFSYPAHTSTAIVVTTSSCDTIYLPHKFLSGTVIVTNFETDEVLKIHFKNKSRLFIGDKIHKRGVYSYNVEEGNTGKVYGGKMFGY